MDSKRKGEKLWKPEIEAQFTVIITNLHSQCELEKEVNIYDVNSSEFPNRILGNYYILQRGIK